jgi:hypothetical protein
MTHAATNMGNVSGRNLATQGYRMDDFFKYGNVLDHAQFLEAYNRLGHSTNPGGQASIRAPQAGGDAARPRSRAVPGELQALQDLRLGEAAKPGAPRAGRKNPGGASQSQSAAKAKQRPALPSRKITYRWDRKLAGKAAPVCRRPCLRSRSLRRTPCRRSWGRLLHHSLRHLLPPSPYRLCPRPLREPCRPVSHAARPVRHPTGAVPMRGPTRISRGRTKRRRLGRVPARAESTRCATTLDGRRRSGSPQRRKKKPASRNKPGHMTGSRHPSHTDEEPAEF